MGWYYTSEYPTNLGRTKTDYYETTTTRRLLRSRNSFRVDLRFHHATLTPNLVPVGWRRFCFLSSFVPFFISFYFFIHQAYPKQKSPPSGPEICLLRTTILLVVSYRMDPPESSSQPQREACAGPRHPTQQRLQPPPFAGKKIKQLKYFF